MSAPGRGPLKLPSPSLLGAGGGQITRTECPPALPRAGWELSTKQDFSERKNETTRKRTESLQNDYKNKHFIKQQDSQEVGASGSVTGPYC